jgi:phosphogluconate dehydratase
MALVDAAEWAARVPAEAPAEEMGVGRELFAMMRHFADPAERGGSAMLALGGL